MNIRVLLLLLVSASVGAQSMTGERIADLDRIVAIVNDDVIVMSELNNRVKTVRAQLRQAGTPAPPDDVLRKQVLERLIVDRVQLEVAERSGVRVDDDTLNQAVEQVARQNNLGLREFREILEREGYDFSVFRKQIRDEIMISRLRQRQVNDKVTVTPREIENFLSTQTNTGQTGKEYQLAHILIAVPEAASPEQIGQARAKAEEVLTRLEDGTDFAQMAVAVSDGQNALKGGDLGWRKVNQIPSFFAEAVTKLDRGKVSEVMRSPNGFHILKAMDVRDQGPMMIDQTNVRHILIRVDNVTSETDAVARLKQLKTRVEGGDDFAELARSNSDDPNSAIKGGDLGWLSPGDLVPEFEQVMNRLKPNELSEPTRTQFGWHIIQVLARRTHDGTDEVKRSEAAEQIRKRKGEEELQAWLRQLRDEAYVEYRLEES